MNNIFAFENKKQRMTKHFTLLLLEIKSNYTSNTTLITLGTSGLLNNTFVIFRNTSDKSKFLSFGLYRRIVIFCSNKYCSLVRSYVISRSLWSFSSHSIAKL